MSVKIGNAKYGGGFVKKNWFKLKDGETVFRILPPIGELAESGRWSKFYNVHYGYKNSAGKMRAFQSPLVKNRQSKMIESPDAALERIELLKGKLDAAKEAAKVSGDDTAVKKLLTLVGGTKSLYNLDSHHYMNVVDLQGNIGILKIRHRAKLALDAKIEKLRGEGCDPLSVEDGRFFVFCRSGSGLDTSFQVEVYQENAVLQGQKVKIDKVHALDEALIARLEKEAGDLNKLFKCPTSEEVARIVETSNIMTGVSAACDEIFDKKADAQAAATTQTEDDDSPGEDYEEPKAAPATAKAAAPAAKPAQTAAPAAAPAAQAPAPAQAAPKGTTQAAKAAAAPAQKAAPAPAPAEQSDEDFLASLGVG